MKKKQDRVERNTLSNNYQPPRRITEDDFDEGFFGPGDGMGMGMGMGMGPPGDSFFAPVDSVYYPAGGNLLFRHEWRQYLYLAEFMQFLGDSALLDMEKEIREGTYLNLTEAEHRNGDYSRGFTIQHYYDHPKKGSHTDLREYDDNQLDASIPPADENQPHREILTLHEFEKARDADRVGDIFAEAADYVPLFENLCYFDAYSHPKTYQLMQTLVLIGFTLAMYFKETFNRKRPSVVDPTLDPVIKVPTFKALPSGHATQVHLIKLMLSEYGPGKGALGGGKKNGKTLLLEELDEAARAVARNREFAGVHYYADAQAGEILAGEIWVRFKIMIEDIEAHPEKYRIRENIEQLIEDEWN